MGGLQTSHPSGTLTNPTLRRPWEHPELIFLPPFLHRLLLLLPGGMCQVCAGLRLQGTPLRQVQLLQIGTPGRTSGGPAHLGGAEEE